MAETKPTLVDKVVNEFMDAVASGEYIAGQKLPIHDELQKRFSVGRNTLREALQRLETLGIITIRQGAGTFLIGMDVSSGINGLLPLLRYNHTDLEQLIETRRILETQTAQLAALRATEEDIAELRTLVEHMEKCRTDSQAYTKVDWQFHMKLAQSTHNSILCKFLDMIYELTQAQQNEIAKMPHMPNISYAYHVDILNAVAAHNTRLAHDLMAEHINNAYQRLKLAAERDFN